MLEEAKKSLLPVVWYKRLFGTVYNKDKVDSIINKYDTYIDKCKTEMQDALSKLKLNIATLEETCNINNVYNNSLKSTIEKFNTEKMDFLSKIKSKDRVIDNLKNQVKELKDELNGKDNKNSHILATKNKEQANFILKLDKEKTKLENTIVTLKKEITTLKKKRQ